jgi:predicted nucleic acid-binding protein
MAIRALLDSNVVIAAVAEAHEHHQSSNALVGSAAIGSLAVAAHSYSEAYSILTRRAASSPFKWPATDAITALESVAMRCSLVGLTHGQTFEAIRDFAAGGGVGPRLYDKLIGDAAVHNQIPIIVSWNSAHFKSLFPVLTIVTPVTFAAEG